ncbi:MAG: hypothetical protein RR909_03205 [Bacilli bacterium]
MNSKVTEFKQQMASIVNKSFYDENMLIRQAKYMFENQNEKWFNVISIFSNVAEATNVHKLVDWQNEFKLDGMNVTNEDGIPFVETYQEVDEENVSLIDKQHIVYVYDISQLHLRNDIYNSILSDLKEQKISDFENLKNHQNRECVSGSFWITFVKNKVMGHYFFIDKKNDALTDFIINLCLLTSNNFIETDDIIINMEILNQLSNDELTDVYIVIHSIISNLLVDYKNHSERVKREKEMEEHLKVIEQRKNRTLKIRIEDAKKILEE